MVHHDEGSGYGSGPPLREIGARLIDDAKAYARAEVDVVRTTALIYVRGARTGIILGVAALVLVLAALPVLVAALGMTLAIWIGVPGGLAVAAVLVILVAALLGWRAARSFSSIADETR